MTDQQLLHRVAQILYYVPAIGDMDCVWCTRSTARRVDFPTREADHLDTWMCLKPGCKGLFCTLRQQIDHPMLLQIDQDGAHALATAKRPVIHTQDPRRGRGWRGMATEQRQERVRTDSNPPSRTLTCACLTSKRKTCFEELSTEAISAPCVGQDHSTQALSEDFPDTARIEAEEPSDVQAQLHTRWCPRQISKLPNVATLDAPRGLVTERACRL